MVLLSTVVAPKFAFGSLHLTPAKITVGLLMRVTRNLCGHPLTNAVLLEVYPDLPSAEKAFWDGTGIALAIRPKGGVRAAASSGDTNVTLDDLEAVLVEWHENE